VPHWWYVLFMPMDLTDKPMEAINEWQDWYRNTKVVAEMDEPLVTKDSREALHDTQQASRNCLMDAKDYWMKKAQEHFADTICDFTNELTGHDLYKAFYAAATENLNIAAKEYAKAKSLVDCLKGLK